MPKKVRMDLQLHSPTRMVEIAVAKITNVSTKEILNDVMQELRSGCSIIIYINN